MLRGIFVDVISEEYDFGQDWDDWLEHIISLTQQVLSNSSSDSRATRNVPLRSFVSLLKRTHISSLFLGLYWWRASSDVSTIYTHIVWNYVAANLQLNSKLPNFNNRDPEGDSDLDKFLSIRAQMSSACAGRKLVISQAGIWGIGVPSARPGDHIVCLNGFPMLLILRPRCGHYRIMGGVYLQGLSDWKIIDDHVKSGDLAEATFRVR